jgi:transcriptional regulator with XRE-family HTH domain
MSPFAEALRALRVTRNLRQKDAAEMLGYEQSYLSALETGAKGPPKQDFIERLARVYALDELERIALKDALSQSKRTLVLPKDASADEFQILKKLKNQAGRLQRRQIALINIALELGECDACDKQKLVSKEMEESRM